MDICILLCSKSLSNSVERVCLRIFYICSCGFQEVEQVPWHLVEAVVLAMPHQGAYGDFEMVILVKAAKVVLAMPHQGESGAHAHDVLKW